MDLSQMAFRGFLCVLDSVAGLRGNSEDFD